MDCQQGTSCLLSEAGGFLAGGNSGNTHSVKGTYKDMQRRHPQNHQHQQGTSCPLTVIVVPVGDNIQIEQMAPPEIEETLMHY